MNEKYNAVLIGCALGDTLGMPVEGWKKAQIEKYVKRITKPIGPVLLKDKDGKLIEQDEFGKLKYFAKDLRRGDITDDTILTLALAESIVENKRLNLEDIAKKQANEYTIRLRPDRSCIGGFGGTTMEGFKNLLNGIPYDKSGIIGGPGNAPAMKMSPVGIYMNEMVSYNEGLEKAELIGEITHLDPRSIVSGIVQAHAVYSLLNNYSRFNFLEALARISDKYERPPKSEFKLYEKGTLTSRLNWIKDNKDASVQEAFNYLGNNSLVFRSYPFAVFMFQKYWDNPIEGLLETVNWGGDCDSTGAMYGALCGAKNGMIFPKEWISELNDLDKINKISQGLSQM